MFWFAVLALALDLGSVKSEPKLEKRSEMALEYASAALDKARTAYKEGRFQQTQAALSEVGNAVELSYESLLATGKNPRKSSKPFKNAEKATREILRRLSGLKDLMSVVDHPVVEPVMTSVTSVHDRLLTGIMTGN
jgi:hypothetical protein